MLSSFLLIGGNGLPPIPVLLREPLKKFRRSANRVSGTVKRLNAFSGAYDLLYSGRAKITNTFSPAVIQTVSLLD
jgi:hypothetical protein